MSSIRTTTGDSLDPRARRGRPLSCSSSPSTRSSPSNPHLAGDRDGASSRSPASSTSCWSAARSTTAGTKSCRAKSTRCARSEASRSARHRPAALSPRAAVRELRRRDVEVVPERPADEGVARHPAQRQRQQPRRHPRHRPLDAQHPLELPAVRGRERRVVGAAPRSRSLPPVDDRAQLAPAGDPEVERGADPLRGQRQAVAGRVADEEDRVLGRRAQPVRDPVALVADRRRARGRRRGARSAP